MSMTPPSPTETLEEKSIHASSTQKQLPKSKISRIPTYYTMYDPNTAYEHKHYLFISKSDTSRQLTRICQDINASDKKYTALQTHPICVYRKKVHHIQLFRSLKTEYNLKCSSNRRHTPRTTIYQQKSLPKSTHHKILPEIDTRQENKTQEEKRKTRQQNGNL